MKICTVIGARPQFIKAAVVSRSFFINKKRGEGKEVILHTGQHYDDNMSSVFFDELQIPTPDYHLGIGGGTHGQNTGRMIEAIEAVLLKETPDMLLVYGDTDSTLAGALAASKMHIPVTHVEAGLRSFNRKMPEETNRVLTDHVSDILFAPTDTAVQNLKAEGIGEGVHLIGDVMYDAMLFYSALSKMKSSILRDLNLDGKKYVLATFHRAENTTLENITKIMSGLAHSPYPVILPLHPRTKKVIESFNLSVADNIHLIGPVGYLDMIALESNAAMIATDSGGVQKEAYFHLVPCVTLRNETEWTELVESGVNFLAGADAQKIAHYLNSDLNNIQFNQGLYGDGHAGDKIADILSRSWSDGKK